MQAELLTIGDEILIGQIINTNAVWMAKELNAIGVTIKQITSVSDEKKHITDALDEALKRADIVLITGGLGPTKDDITKTTLAEYFGVGLKKEARVIDFIKENFAKRNIEFLPVHELQALILENSEILFNHYGTAPGMWIENNGKIIVIMPGVPFEMKGIMSKYVLPRLSTQFNLPFIIHKTIVTIGLPESNIADMISDIEDELSKHIKLAYLPNFGMVRLRLSGIGKDEKILKREIESYASQILKIIPAINIGATEDLKPEEIIGQLLTSNKQTLAISESCTGGYISHLITTVPGSSEYFIGSLIAYSYQIKINNLGVKAETLEKFGAVSEECVREMVEGIKTKFKTDFAISTTGIAGPGGATPDKPVGLVWIAVAGSNGIVTRKLMANGERINVIERTAIVALDMLRREILNVEL
ncbi:MAG: competence/damage-inducible protein A [Bacteroidia bacterium]